MKKALFTKVETAKALNCSISKLDSLMANKAIQYFKYGNSQQSSVRFSILQINEYLENRKV